MADPAKKLVGRALTTELRKLASEVHTCTDSGDPITKEQLLARMVWDLALGVTEMKRDEEGNLKRIEHKPVAWAQQFLFDRLEGKAVPTTPENETGVRAADKVRELAKNRLNGFAEKALSAKRRAEVVVGPPKYEPKGGPVG